MKTNSIKVSSIGSVLQLEPNTNTELLIQGTVSRIRSLHGKLVFADIFDNSGSMQIMLQQNSLSQGLYTYPNSLIRHLREGM